MSYLLGITVGPVQSYIEESRKLKDLYNSSRIISDIMKEIYNSILEISKDSEIIYPNHKGVQNVEYSNYMIFKINKIIDLKGIEDKVYCRFDKFIDNIKQKINCKNAKYYKNSIRGIFHLFWAIEEIKCDEKCEKVENSYETEQYKKAYTKTYENLTWLISSLKNTYEFEQVTEEGTKKCLICGKKNIVTKNLKDTERKNYKLNTDEDLCLLCLFKRIYNSRDNRLQSTYSIAINEWKKTNKDSINEITKNLKNLFQEEDKYYNPNEIDNIIKILQDKKTLEQAENLISYADKKKINKKLRKIKYEFKDTTNLIGNIEKIKKIKQDLSSIYNNKDKNKNIELPNYEYCFIQFDIDNLGRWMSGVYLENQGELENFQKKLSNILVKFGKILKDKLKDKCSIIYSGGDDFLGILPNENIIQVIEIIDTEFNIEVKSKLKEYTNYCRQITYSTSITIAQCKDPMSYALSKTRIELENVKKRYENKEVQKNGVAINYIINNGKEITCYLGKEDLDGYFELIKDFKNIKSDLSFSYINNFENEFKSFKYMDIACEESRNFSAIASYELKRLMRRSKIKNYNNEKQNIEKYINEMVNYMGHIIYKNKIELKSNHQVVDFRNIINILKLVKKLSNIQFNLNNARESEKK